MFRFMLILIIFLSLQSLYRDGQDLNEGRLVYESKRSNAEHSISNFKHDFKGFTYKWYVLVIGRFATITNLVCAPSGITNDKVLSIVGEYVQKPVKSNPSASIVIFDALEAAHLCQT